MRYRLSIDISRTYIDFALVDEKGNMSIIKAEHDRNRPLQAIEEGLRDLTNRVGMTIQELLGQCDMVTHGTTIASETLLMHKGARVGLLCTKGFRDSLEMRLGYKEKRYDFKYLPPLPLVPRYLRLEVEERVDKEGNIYTPLNEENVYLNAERFKKNEVESIAISFLWSFLNPIHERRAGEIIKEIMPNVFLSLSSEIIPLIREYDRTSTTVINAYIGPACIKYLDEFETVLYRLGYKGKIYYVQSNGGLTTKENLIAKPILTLGSGPTTSSALGSLYGSLLEYSDIITLDMGSADTNVSLIKNDVIEFVKGNDFFRYRCSIPMVGVNTINFGGYNIAEVDRRGLLRINSEQIGIASSQSYHGKKGKQPTLIDSYIILGYLNPQYLLGGRLKIDANLSRKIVYEEIAEPLNLSVAKAALAIFNLMNSNIARYIEEITAPKGLEARDFIMVSGGGCGPIHAGRVAKEVKCRSLIIPRYASTISLFGQLLTDLKYSNYLSYLARIDNDKDLSKLNAAFDKIEGEGYEALEADGVSKEDVDAIRTMDIRYVGQIYECTIPIPYRKIDQKTIGEILDSFHNRHEELYGYHDVDAQTEIVNIGSTLIGKIPKITFQTEYRTRIDAKKARKGERMVFFEEFDDYTDTPIFDGKRIKAGNVINGPAIVEEEFMTLVVFPESEIELDGRGGGFYVYKI